MKGFIIMDKKYFSPAMEIIIFSDQDIIQTSSGNSSYDLGEWIKPNTLLGGVDDE
mgnify:CR=1 FL=1